MMMSLPRNDERKHPMANDPLVFNTDGMRTVASTITTNANKALGDHAVAWQRMQNHIQSYPGNLSNLLLDILHPHNERMCQSYHWQLSFASALSGSADTIDEAEAEIAQLFS
jgi:hypothetical protein